VALFSAIVLFEVIRRRIGGVQGRRLAGSFFKISAASLLMGAACAISSHWMGQWAGFSRLARTADLAVSVPFGLLVFYGTAKLFHLPEIESANRAFVAPLARRLGFIHVKI
jgi:hypothetical protein